LFGTASKIYESKENTQVLANQDIDVLIIGGGPVGLWTACQIKIKRPSTRILVIEKHSEYQRSHIVSLNLQSLHGSGKHEILNKLKQDIEKNNNIRTNDLENRLVNLCDDLNIEITKNYHVDSVKKITQEFPNVSVIIGADGSHSIIRKQIFGNKMKFYEYLQFIVEIKYEVEGSTRLLAFLTEAYPTMKIMGCVATEHIGKEINGKTPVTLRLFVDEETLESLKEATFKNPFCLPRDNHKIDQSVSRKIKVWLSQKTHYCKEKAIENTIKITTTKLAAYASRAFVYGDITNGAHICLVGDAAFGVPFFRSLNNGLICGTELAKEVCNHFNAGRNSVRQSRMTDSVIGQVTEHFTSYARFCKGMAWPEIVLARTKSAGVSSFEKWTTISAVVPWQINKLSPIDILRIKDDDNVNNK